MVRLAVSQPVTSGLVATLKLCTRVPSALYSSICPVPLATLSLKFRTMLLPKAIMKPLSLGLLPTNKGGSSSAICKATVSVVVENAVEPPVAEMLKSVASLPWV